MTVKYLTVYILGCSQAAKTSDFDSDIRVFESHHPSQMENEV